jgi:histidine ammonia-lyase
VRASGQRRAVEASELGLSEDLRRRQLQLYNQAFSASETAQPAPFDDAEWETIQNDVATRTAAVVGEDLQLLAPDADISGKEARYCEVAAELMNQLSLTPQTARVFAAFRAEQAATN